MKDGCDAHLDFLMKADPMALASSSSSALLGSPLPPPPRLALPAVLFLFRVGNVLKFPMFTEEREAEEEDGVVYPYRHGDGTGLEVRLVPVTARDPSLGGPSLGDPEDDEGGDARETTKERKTRQRRKDASRAWT